MSARWIGSLGDLERLIEGRIPEGPSLEYKESLVLTTERDRVEALKDLTGMANGGGGTLIFGVREAEGQDGIPAEIAPIGDRAVIGRLEDVVRSGVRPPLTMTLTVLDREGGFVLVADVFPSELGPYMVEAYGQHRYFTRQGTRTVPMTEQQVRDAYALAQRARERRQHLWEEHDLPLRPPEPRHPWISVSALPWAPVTEILDLTRIRPEAFARPTEWLADLAPTGRFDCSTESLWGWRDGIFGACDDPPKQLFRLHRDGAACLGARIGKAGGDLPWYAVFRAANAQLLYLAWVWEKLDLRMPVEIHLALWNLSDVTVNAELLAEYWPEDRRIRFRRPPGVAEERLNHVSVVQEVLPRELRRASVRHRLVRGFADRLHQAFGSMRADPMFRYGWLYGPDGSAGGLSLTLGAIWGEGGRRIGAVHEDGVIQSDRTQEVLGFVVDGVVLDREGRAMAALEMAPGVGLPDDFLVRRPHGDPRPRISVGYHGSPDPPTGLPVPDPRGEWSPTSLSEAVRGA